VVERSAHNRKQQTKRISVQPVDFIDGPELRKVAGATLRAFGITVENARESSMQMASPIAFEALKNRKYIELLKEAPLDSDGFLAAKRTSAHYMSFPGTGFSSLTGSTLQK
jgi:hypothetical protein